MGVTRTFNAGTNKVNIDAGIMHSIVRTMHGIVTHVPTLRGYG